MMIRLVMTIRRRVVVLTPHSFAGVLCTAIATEHKTVSVNMEVMRKCLLKKNLILKEGNYFFLISGSASNSDIKNCHDVI